MKKDIIINDNTIKKAKRNQSKSVEMEFYRDIIKTADKWKYRNLTFKQMNILAESAFFRVVNN